MTHLGILMKRNRAKVRQVALKYGGEVAHYFTSDHVDPWGYPFALVPFTQAQVEVGERLRKGDR